MDGKRWKTKLFCAGLVGLLVYTVRWSCYDAWIMTIIFGIDPGSVYTGFGVIKKVGARLEHVDSGRICAGQSGKQAFAKRLALIYKDLCGLLQEHKPQVVAIECVFSHINVASALKLGQARGVALLACEQHVSGEIYEFSPKAVKKAVTGYGAAKKQQMQYMVQKLLNIRGELSEDAADALSMAIFCASHHRFEGG